MHVNGPFFDVSAPTPDMVKQLAAVKGSSCVAQHKFEQAKFGRAKHNSVAVDGELVRTQIEQQFAGGQLVFGGQPRAPEQGANASDELFGRKRLGDVVVDTGFKALELVAFFPACGEHDDRRFASKAVISQSFGEINALHAG